MFTNRSRTLGSLVGPLAASLILIACKGGGGDGDPTPTPTPGAAENWESAAITFDGSNNPNDTVLCVGGGSQQFASWVGQADVSVADGTSLLIGDHDGTGIQLASTECVYDPDPAVEDDEVCYAGTGSLTRCLMLFYGETRNAEDRLQINLLWVYVENPTSAWVTGQAISFGRPLLTDSPSSAFGNVLIDNDDPPDDDISFDAQGQVVAPDTRTITGVTEDGGTSAMTLSAAGTQDGEQVAIDGTADFVFAPYVAARPSASGPELGLPRALAARMSAMERAVIARFHPPAQ